MKEINKISENESIQTPNFNEVCSTDIENLAREYMCNIKDIDENLLVEYLARGKAIYTEEEEKEKIKELGKFRYKLKTSKIITNCLEKACEIFKDSNQLSTNTLDEEQTKLINLLNEGSKELDKQCPSNSKISQELEIIYHKIHNLSNNIAPLRSELVNLLSSNQPIPLPTDLHDLEKEKNVLCQCIEAVTKSAENMTNYLSQSRFVNYKINTYEEVCNIYNEYESICSDYK